MPNEIKTTSNSVRTGRKDKAFAQDVVTVEFTADFGAFKKGDKTAMHRLLADKLIATKNPMKIADAKTAEK